MNFVIVRDDLHTKKFWIVARVSQGKRVLQEFKDVFEKTLGKLHGLMHLEGDPNITPHTAATHRVPVTIKEELNSRVEEANGKKRSLS